MRTVTARLLIVAGALLSAGAGAWADEPTVLEGQASAQPVLERMRLVQASSFRLDEGYALGVTRFNVDSHTEVIGWKLTNSIYFGHQDGEDSGLSLVWQNDANQVSLSKDGLRLTHRFR